MCVSYMRPDMTSCIALHHYHEVMKHVCTPLNPWGGQKVGTFHDDEACSCSCCCCLLSSNSNLDLHRGVNRFFGERRGVFL